MNDANFRLDDLDDYKRQPVEPKIQIFQDWLREFTKPIYGRIPWMRELRTPRSMWYPHMTEEEKTVIPLIISAIKNDLKPSIEDLKGLFNSEFQKKLIEAIDKVAHAKFMYGEHGEVDFFEGTYTIVVMAKDGSIIGGETNPINKKGVISDLYQHYQNNLMPFALTKAALQWALWLSYREEDITKEGNYEYLQSLLGENTPIFLGSAPTLLLNTYGYWTEINVGVSGAEGSEDLLKRHFKDEHLKQYYQFGGGIDQIFANAVVKELHNPTEGPIVITMKDVKSGFGMYERLNIEKFRSLLVKAS